jgi:hypothetical protein
MYVKLLSKTIYSFKVGGKIYININYCNSLNSLQESSQKKPPI